MKERIAKNDILIKAPLAKVWEVIIAPKFIRQWDSLPQDFADYYLEVGAEIIWQGHSRRVVTEMIPHERLRLSLHIFKWDLAPSAHQIGYTYELAERGENTLLSLAIGDFGEIDDAEKYYSESVEFVESVLRKIRVLAENKG